jgi:alcohol dehydrogenase class IV
MRFEFATATKIIFGAGTLKEIGPLAKGFGKRALIVTGRNPGRAEPLLKILREHNVETLLFAVSGEPEIETVNRGTSLAKIERCDFVISFGGGSALDAGKAIAAMMTNPDDLLDYLEVIGRGKTLGTPSAPFVAIPTTAGTGAEVTRNSVLASPAHRVKVSLRSPYLLPNVALVDPELTYDLPPALTASTGLDALTQLIEPYVSVRTNPMTDALCVRGIGQIAQWLRPAFADGRDRVARQEMSAGSLFGGMALANAGLGVVHGFAASIGGMFAAPHGAICAALLPEAMKMNLDALGRRAPDSPAIARYGEIAQWLTGKPAATANEGVEWVRQLIADLKIPRLGSYGVRSEQVTELSQKAANASSTKANPIVLTPDELASILESAL